MGEALKISIPAGYAMDCTRHPAGSDATRVVLTIWAMDGHPPWEHEVSLALSPMQRLQRVLKNSLSGIVGPR